MYDSFAFFQFAVDNAASIERSVALLLSELPTHSDWILEYLANTSHTLILFGFFREYIPHADPEQFRTFLQASRVCPDRLLEAACDRPDILEILEIPSSCNKTECLP
jgi:hypothetical protein